MKITGSYDFNHPKPLFMDDENFGAGHKTSHIMSKCTSGCGLLAKIKTIFSKLLGIRNVPSAMASPKKKVSSAFICELKVNPKFRLAAENSEQPPATQTLFKLYQLQQLMVKSTINILQENHKGYDVTFLQKLSTSLQAHKFSEDRLANPQEIASTHGLKKQLQRIIKQALIQDGIKGRQADRQSKVLYHNGMKNLLNNQQWKVLTTQFEHKGHKYKSVQIPAGQMKLGRMDIFAHTYNNKGVSSKSTQEKEHAVNLWISETFASSREETLLFKGIRHGILSPFGLDQNSPERNEGAENRAREVICAALYAKPELLANALKGETVPLRLVSTSLVTASMFFEKRMLDEQMNVWHKLASEKPLVLQIRDEHATLRKIQIDLDVATFNFGVNELSLKLKLGNRYADSYNATAFNRLLGHDMSPGAEPGGWVGEYLQQKPHNAALVRHLSAQLQTIWRNRSHHSDNNEPYKAAKRVALLTHEIGITPCWNCKSGKDRTGVLDIELKHGAIIHHQQQMLGSPGSKPSHDDKLLLEKLYQHSGNLDVQEFNTGAPGNKVAREIPIIGLSNAARIGNRDTWHVTRGLSSVV